MHSVFESLLSTISGSCTNMLADVAKKHPSWAKEIDKFIKNAECDNAAVVNIANNDVDATHVAAFREARIAPMAASAARNVDEEATSKKATHAPTNTDCVESGYGTFDQVMHKTAASIFAVFGIVMMRRTHMLQTQLEIKEKSRTAKKRKLAHIGKTVGYGEEIEGDDSEKWDLCSLMAWPKERRFALYRSVLANYDEACVNQPKAQALAHDQESYKRKLRANEDEERRVFKKAIQQQVWFGRKRAVTKAGLTGILKGKTGNKLLEALRDQVNIRRYVDGTTEPIPKRKGGWLSGSLEASQVEQLKAHVEVMVKEEKYTKPPAIVPALRAEPTAPHLSTFAQELGVEREKKLEKLRGLLQKCMADGSFKTYLRSKKAPAKLKAPARLRQQKQQPTAKEKEALRGSVFDDEGITWKVLKVEWDDDLGSIIVFYYDHDSATREGLDEDELHEDHDYVEHSSLEEVLDWIKN